MSTTIERHEVSELQRELTAFRHNWRGFVLLGATLIIVGFIALGSLVWASLATVVAIGALLLVAGLAEAIGAFWCRGWSAVLHLFSGVLSSVVGTLFLLAPIDAMLALTLLLSCLLMAGGVFKIITTFSYRLETSAWPLVSGFVDLILGMLILMAWPDSALWVLGLYVGISLVFRGINWIGLGMAFRRRNERLEGMVRHGEMAGRP